MSISNTALTIEDRKLLFTNLLRADEYDRTMYKRMMSGKLLGFYHPGEGAIAPGIGAATFLNQDDVLSPHHRAHGMAHALAKGVDLKPYLAEHTGKAGGCSEGRSSFHMSFPEHKIYMFSGFIGFNFAPAVGYGYAAKLSGKGQVVMMCSGDGSYGQGRAHEAMLMAQNMKLPIIFWCENNGLAIHAEASEMHPMPDISSLADGYGMPKRIVDGQDVFACAEAAREAIDHAREGKGPMFVECKTLRLKEHDIGTPDLIGSTPRSKEDILKQAEREPVKLAMQKVLADGLFTMDEIDDLRTAARAEVEAAWDWADAQPFPEDGEAELMTHVFAPNAEDAA
ncbi:thiamine pyrophosphate-dependent dehydrogenase E1 component subunit alpha [Tropicibacter sp. R16_0]|uniref:thiamine pyrophosphate-dependent dehydrogenase E1 component subunit alpha n=1 Tax=Tropicibacter sp. R16_0 TaxID=2821102 RepID=UPI001AD989D3|nr:thiamine pyrophosphate-dependent dehydrogenase E1 component subunit alpha [Tropicibacter sp. R16_0]MBO9453417.1 thiamine pyrophosphate-dependent dehydrogenase E1 component subunit alpha [Tropicibacter sp. R16_0]